MLSLLSTVRPRSPYRGWYVTAIVALYAFLSTLHPGGTGYDQGVGFLTWQSMQKGSPPNYIRAPDPAEISRDVLEFNAWWSPGQYVVPAIFSLFGASLGTGMLLTTILFSVSGVLGYFRLFKQLGFSEGTVSVGCALIVSSAGFALSFGNYSGGEVLLFGACPWILSLCLEDKEIDHRRAALLVLVFLAGSFLKTSFSVYALGIVSTLILARAMARGDADYQDLWWHSVKAIGVFVMFYTILYLGYLSWGRHPGMPHGFRLSVLGVLVPLSLGPLNALLVADLLERMGFSVNGTRLIHLGGAASLPALLYLIWKSRRIAPVYKSLALGMSIAYAAVFAYLYLTQTLVSQEARHFVPLGLILIPGVVQIWRESSFRILRVMLVVTALVGGVHGLRTFWLLHQQNALSKSIGSLGFAQAGISAGALRALRVLDDRLSHGNNLFFVPSPEIAVEIQRNRVFNAHLKSADGRYHGRVDNVFVLVRGDRSSDREEATELARFVDYAVSEWQRIRLESSSLYFQGTLELSQIEGWLGDGRKRIP